MEPSDASMTMRTLKQRDKGHIKMTLKRREPVLTRKPVLAKKIYRMSSKLKQQAHNEYNTHHDDNLPDDSESKADE